MKRTAIWVLAIGVSVLATVYFVPRLWDGIIYDHVADGCWGSLELEGHVGGRHCRGVGELLTEVPGVGTMATTFAGQGHVVAFGEPIHNDGKQRAVSYAIVRTPGEDGQWLCGSSGTLRVEKDLSTTLELTTLHPMTASGEATISTATLDASLGACPASNPHCFESSSGSFGGHGDSAHFGRKAGTKAWVVRIRADDPGVFNKPVEGLALQGISSGGVQVAYATGEDLGSVARDGSTPIIDLALTNYGRCGPKMKVPALKDDDGSVAQLTVIWSN